MNKDPLTYDLVTYAGVLLLAVWGGVVSWIQRNKDSRVMSVAELLGEIVISGFSGIMVFFICEAHQVPPLMTAALVGVAGHLGSRTIFLLEQRLGDYLDRLKKRDVD